MNYFLVKYELPKYQKRLSRKDRASKQIIIEEIEKVKWKERQSEGKKFSINILRNREFQHYLNCSRVLSEGESFIFFKDFIYLFLEGERKAVRKRGRETSMCGCLLCASYWGPSPQPRHVPWLGIDLATLWFTGLCAIHWATPARAEFS